MYDLQKIPQIVCRPPILARQGATPLHAAARLGHTKLVKLLLEGGCEKAQIVLLPPCQ